MNSEISKAIVLVIAATFTLSCGPTTSQTPSDTMFEVQRRPDAPAREHVDRGTIWYRITLSDAALDVRVRLLSPPAMTRFFLPGSWAGRSDYANRIRIAGAVGPEGPRFLTIDRRDGRIDVESENAEWVELHYRVDLEDDETQSLLPRYAGGVLRAFGPAFLVLPAQQILDRTIDIPIEVHLPASWTVVSTWNTVATQRSRANPDNQLHAFMAPDAQALRDAFLVAGPQVHVDSRPSDIQVAFDPEFRGDRVAISRAIESAVVNFRAQFGDLGPTRVFVDAVQSIEAGAVGGLGRHGGFILELAPNAPADASTLLVLVHEALHLWNGHHLVPEPGLENSLRWFKEGVTHYIAIRNACRQNGFDMRDALAELARVADNYNRNPIVLGGAVRPVDELRFPYDFGVLFALSVDAALVSSTDRRLEDWLLTLEAVLASKQRARYDDEILYEAYRRVVGESPGFADLWRHHVRGRVPIQPMKLMDRIGLHFIPSGPDRTARLIALDRANPLYLRMLGECHER